MKATRNSNYHRLEKLILDTFLELTRSSVSGYKNVTITELCYKAEIFRSTFYSHYSSIWELINNYLKHLFKSLSSTNVKEGYDNFFSYPKEYLINFNRMVENEMAIHNLFLIDENRNIIIAQTTEALIGHAKKNPKVLKYYTNNAEIEALCHFVSAALFFTYHTYFKGFPHNDTFKTLAIRDAFIIKKLVSD